MSSLRTLLCGLLGVFIVTAGVKAQEVRDTVGPLEERTNPITPENPIPRRVSSTPAIYPPEARSIDANATVTLVATLDESGRVAEIRKVREPLVMTPLTPPPGSTALRLAAEALVRYSALSLSQWRYDAPAKAPISFPVSFTFKPGTEPVATQSVSVSGAFAGALPPPPPPPPPPGSPLPPATSTFGPAAEGAVRVGGSIRPPTQISKVAPVYPLIAQSARVQGVVILEALIGADGRVRDAQVLRSIPLLDQAALDAVRQWVYTPTLLNGVATPIIMTVTVTFTLPGDAIK